jgi:hypothetical protein
MKSIQEVHQAIDEYHDSKCVGMLLLHSAPGGRVEIWNEQTIKLNELDREFREAILTLFAGLNFLKCEVVCGPNGPDRLKVTRRL